MSAGDTTQGQRLPDDTDIDDWMFKRGRDARPAQPGEYIVNQPRDTVWVCLPNGITTRIPIKDRGFGEAVWGFTEHDDGTITLSPSVFFRPNGGEGSWHGFLERGVWREV